jgi:ABC-type sugar transport system permease subunit
MFDDNSNDNTPEELGNEYEPDMDSLNLLPDYDDFDESDNSNLQSDLVSLPDYDDFDDSDTVPQDTAAAAAQAAAEAEYQEQMRIYEQQQAEYERQQAEYERQQAEYAASNQTTDDSWGESEPTPAPIEEEQPAPKATAPIVEEQPAAGGIASTGTVPPVVRDEPAPPVTPPTLKADEYMGERAERPEMSAAEKAKNERYMAKRQVMIDKKLKAFDIKREKEFEKINKAEIREKSKTKDATKQREIELMAEKRREEYEILSAQERRGIATSTGNKLSYERRKSLYGYGFIAIWAVGVLLIFLGPLIQSVIFSLSDTKLVNQNQAVLTGEKAGIHTDWNDFEHYKHAITVDGDFTVDLVFSLTALAPQVLMILIFSLFVAVLLNQKFKGRTLMRAIFFFPVLIATGPVIAIINGEIMASGATGGAAQFSTMFQTDMVDGFLRFLGMYNVSEQFATFISNATSDIFNLLWKSGIQILIFLSALQQIPTSAKEAASMEGATAWEFFWKITFPTISPMILANLIYTIIDTFSDSQNLVMRQVFMHTTDLRYGYAAALAWIYFGIIALALAIVVGIVSRFVFYAVE